MITLLQSVQVLQDVTFLILSQHNIYTGNTGHGIGLKLSVAAGHNDIGIGVLTHNLMDGLAAFLVGHLGHRTGVYHADIGLLATHGLMRTGLNQLAHNGRCLREV